MLPPDECARLLGIESVGRLAIVVGGRPQVFPVNYKFAEGVVVFRSSAGFKLEHSPMSDVAFEIDHVDLQAGIAWSVLVEGVAYRITDAMDPLATRLRSVEVQPMAPGAHEEWIGIYPSVISGRRFPIQAE
jgi:uncharacterized protein